MYGHGGGRRFAGGLGGRGLRSGRKLGGKDLQLLVLALLAEAPAHGYELIRKIEERSAGFYTPSPGVVYPALTYLEELGQAEVEVAGNRKCYSITDIGLGRLNAHRDVANELFAELARIGARMERAQRAFEHGERDDEEIDSAADVLPAEAGDSHDEVHVARLMLKRALHGTLPHCSATQLVRVAEILRRAADEIVALGRSEKSP